MNKVEFFKEAYYFELKRRQELTTSLTIPIGIASFFVGAIFYYLQTFKFFPSNGVGYVFVLLVLFALISVVISIYYQFRSYYGYIYGYLPRLDDLNNFYDDLLEYGNSYNKYLEEIGKEIVDPKLFADQKYKEEISEAYLLAVVKNFENNRLKSVYLHNANGALIFTFVFLLMSSIPYFVNFYTVSSN